jgi:ABC-type glycerol-3-phosphate transport system permease component
MIVARGDASRKSMSRRLGQATAYIVLIAFSVLIVIPLLWAVSASIHTNANLFEAPFEWLPPAHWSNYSGGWRTVSFGTDMVNSAIVGLVTSLASVVFGLMAAYAFAKLRFPGRRLLFIAVLSILLLPFPAIVVPVFTLARQLGIVNSYAGLIVPGLLSAGGVFLMRQYLLGFPDALLEAARVDGAGESRIFVRIVVPLCWPVMAAVGILNFVGSWNNLLWPLVVVSSPRLYTIPLGLEHFNSTYFTDYVGMVAMSVVAILPVVALFLVSRKRIMSSMMVSGGAVVG